MVQEQLRKEAARLLREGEVDVFIGYARGSLPAQSTVVFARSSEDAQELVFDPTCHPNLAVYLPRFKKERVGVVVKACDARALVELIRERQVDPDKVLAIGVECPGVIDRDRWEEGMSLDDGEWKEALAVACEHCRLPAVDLFHCWLGEKKVAVEEADAQVSSCPMDEDSEERYRWFSAEMEKCIRCYACRQACPACYCPECFTDRSHPDWVSPVHEPPEAMLFHLVRTLHLAGRCTDCGACARACPQNINLLALHRRMEAEAVRRFGYLSGQDPDAPSLLGSFSKDDSDDFIK